LTRAPLIVVCAMLLASPALAQFVQQGQKLLASDAVGNASQGSSVAISADGNTAIVGGPGDNASIGAAWIWVRNNGVWTQQGTKLLGADADARISGSPAQGTSVAISADGNTAVVGGPKDNVNAGAVWVWTRSGAVWSQQGSKLVGSGAAGIASQGFSVALSSDGNTLIVGGVDDADSVGAVWVWTRTAGVWTQQGDKLVGSGASGTGKCKQGWSVALASDGNTAIVGCPIDDAAAGAAWVWTRNAGVWTQQGPKLTDSDFVRPAQQGASVSLSGDGNTAIVGAFTDNNFVGAARVWARTSGTWTQQAKLVGSGAVANSAQGRSVSLSATGDTAIVGGPSDTSGTGATWVWTRSGGTWRQRGAKLVGSGTPRPFTSPRQGDAVALSGDGRTVIVGGPTDDFGAGGVWIFYSPVPTMSLDQTSLRFGAVTAGSAFNPKTPAQSVRLSQSGIGTVTWSAASTVPWLVVSPASGTGDAVLSISTQFASGLVAAQTGQIALTFSGASNTASPINVTLTIAAATDPASAPFGGFDTPAGDGTALAGSVAVTGWALDNIGVRRVELWRDLVAGESTTPFASTPADPRNGKVFIATPTFVAGARPDVEALYSTTPFAYGAGWGYLLLTWGLPNQGSGTYQLYAYAFDEESNVATLGTKTIVVSNNTAAKPFGSIDTPAIGGDASGPNFGWALTPKVNGAATCRIPSSGVHVSIDSGPLQPVAYGDVRSDVAAAFTGFSNSAAAGGHSIIDWTALANGVHTIGWVVWDDCNRADGVGSRFFNVSNGTNLVTLESLATAGVSAMRVSETESDAPITVAHGFGELPVILTPGEAGSRTVEVKQGERIEMRLPRGFESAYQLAKDGERRALPTGSTWDSASAIFYWQPAPGFLGRYRLVFSNGTERISVRVVVTP
jgi:hypothetical protein